MPIALVVWLAVATPRSAAGFWIQALTTGAGLFAIGLTGLWLIPPWWTPWAIGVLLAVIILADVSRRRRHLLFPNGFWGWLGLAGVAAFGLYAANTARIAVAGRSPPAGQIIDLASPLGPGRYFVANGGAALAINAHYEVLDASVLAHRPWLGQAYGVDLVAIDGWGLRADSMMPSEPGRYLIFGKPIVAPCAGKVVVAIDGLPDNVVPHADSVNLAGNHVFLRCGANHIVLGHFRKGSLRVHVGQVLAIGAPVAEVGNSGNSSEPHLHIHAQAPGTAGHPFSGAPIPIRIDGRFLVRNDRFAVPKARGLP
ncbi:MAG: M23 family metallopeptidase [Hyphomicrobium aestuarii]|nr:M23 family metallopeptidase [Hyphomicrobium aestuarii]